MADTTIYIVDNTDGTLSFSIQPRTYDGSGGVQRTTDLTLQGNGMPNWGERQNENFMRLLENSAVEQVSGSPPLPMTEGDVGTPGRGINLPVIGQTWYNKTDQKMYVCIDSTLPGTWQTVGGSIDHGELSGLVDDDHPQYIHENGDTMLGALVIDYAAGSDLLRLESDSGPTLNISSTVGGGLPPAIVLHSAENEASYSHGYTRFTARDGDYFTVEVDTDDQDAVADGTTTLVLEAKQTGIELPAASPEKDQLYYWLGGVRVPNQPDYARLDPTHLITKQNLEDYGGFGDPVPLVGKTFIPATDNAAVFHIYSDTNFGPSGPGTWEGTETIDLTAAGVIPENATHVMVRCLTNTNERGNNVLTHYARRDSSESWATKVSIDVTRQYSTSGNHTYEGESTYTFVQEFDTDTDTMLYRYLFSRHDAGTWGQILSFSVRTYLEGWFIDDEAATLDYVPTHVTRLRELVTGLTGNPVVTLSTLEYTVGFDTLEVYLNGQKAVVGVDYTESTESTFTWIGTPLVPSDTLECFSSDPISAGEADGFKNMVINGDFTNWQRGLSGTSAPPPQYASGTNAYAADRFGVRTTAGDVLLDWSMSTDVPNITAPRSLEVTPQLDDAIATSAAAIQYTIQHEDVRKLQYGASEAQSSVLSFWVKSSVPGIYSVNIRSNFNGNPSTTYSFIEEYVVNVADTWEKKAIVIPALTAGGTLPWITGIDDISGSINWWLKGGTANSGTTGVWIAGAGGLTSKYSPSQVNWKASSTNTFNLALVQWEIGQTATKFEVLPRAQARELCQMFYCKTYAFIQEPGTATTTGAINFHGNEPVYPTIHNLGWSFPVVMKRSPDVRCWSNITGLSTYNGSTTFGTVRSNRDSGVNDFDRTVGSITTNDSRVTLVNLTSDDPNNTFDRALSCHYTADAEDYFDDPE